jgi:hypothetical protein
MQHVSEEGKVGAIYFYNDDSISMQYKALSAVKVLKNKMVFLALANPSDEIMKQF